MRPARLSLPLVLNCNMKRICILLLLVASATATWAYDFKVQVRDYALYFNIIDADEHAVEVTAPLTEGNNRWAGEVPPAGILTIPAEVEWSGHTYTVVAIADRAFYGCTDITALTLPPTLTDIGAYAFSMCTALRGEITIGESIVSLGRSAFFGCSGITTVHFNAANCLFMGGSRSSTVFGNCRSLTKVTFGPKVQRIPDYAFTGMNLLKMEWNLPEGIEYIGDYAFAFCSSISGTLTLPSTTRRIGKFAFTQCHDLKAVVFPSRMENIGQRAFYQCINLAQMTSYALLPPVLEADVFTGIRNTAVVNVPCVSVERYREAEGWGKLRNLNPMQPCSLEITVRSNDTVAGSVMGSGLYRVGDTATLVAVCKAGYSFRSWTDSVTDNPRRIVITDTTTYTAIFQSAEVMHEVQYVHDTVYRDGVQTIYRTVEANDVAKPIGQQEMVVYNRANHRVELGLSRRDIMSLDLYNDVGQCVYTGKPLLGFINMRTRPSGYYIIRVTTLDNEYYLRFFHSKR